MKLTILLLLFINCLSFSNNNSQLNREIDSLKTLIHSNTPRNTRQYHNNVIELYRKYRYYNSDSAEYYLNFGLEISSKYKLDLVTRDYYNIKGLFAFDKSDFSQALENFYKCLEYSYRTNEIGAVGYTYSDIGYVFYVQGLWDLALEHYKAGINSIYEYDSLNTISLPLLYQNCGLSFGQLNQIDSAVHYLNMALDFYEKIDNKEKINHTNMYLGHIYRRHKKDNNKALKYYFLAMEHFKKDRTWLDGYPYTLFNIGESYAELKNYDKTLEFYIKAIEEMDKLGWRKKIIDVNFKIAYVYLELDKYNKVDSVLNVNHELIKEFESLDLYIDSYVFNYKYFKKLGKSDSALFYYEKFRNLNDSLIETSITGQIASVLKDLQINKNSRENEIIAEQNIQRIYLLLFIIILFVFLIVLAYSRLRLQKKSILIQNDKNAELEKTNKLLDEANETKDKFFSIIAHDLKNPIGAIKSTSELLVTDYDMFEEHEIKDSISDIFNSASSVQILLDSLLTWSRSQRGKLEFLPETFNFNMLINNIFFLLKSNADKKGIKLIKVFDESLEIFADTNMLNTVIRNLISNAIKFTPENGEIKITANKNEKFSQIIIEDNGIGISKENQIKLFNVGTNYTTPGTNDEKGTGLGLILVSEFIDRHKGTIDIQSEINQGTKFIINIPNE